MCFCGGRESWDGFSIGTRWGGGKDVIVDVMKAWDISALIGVELGFDGENSVPCFCLEAEGGERQ